MLLVFSIVTASGSVRGSPWNAAGGGVDDAEGLGVEKVTVFGGWALGLNETTGTSELKLEELGLTLEEVDSEAEMEGIEERERVDELEGDDEGEGVAEGEGVEERVVDERVDDKRVVDERDIVDDRNVDEREIVDEREEVDERVVVDDRDALEERNRLEVDGLALGEGEAEDDEAPCALLSEDELPMTEFEALRVLLDEVERVADCEVLEAPRTGVLELAWEEAEELPTLLELARLAGLLEPLVLTLDDRVREDELLTPEHVPKAD